MTKNKEVLLVVYSFPPYPGIGGRRWAKIAKYLCRKGYNVHIICAENPYEEKSIFIKDIEGLENLHIHNIPPHYPLIISPTNPKKPTRLLDKVRYKLWQKILLISQKGSIYDLALFWEKPFLKVAQDLIKAHNIQNIIASGAPFRTLYYCTELKTTFPNINFIADFRDPWTWGSLYGIKSLSEKRLSYEKYMQDTVIASADFVTIPVEDMRDYLKNNYPVFADKVRLIAHAYDADEIEVKPKKESPLTRMVFYGSLYGDTISHYIDLLCKVFQKNKTLFSLDIFSNTETHKDKFEEAGLSEEVKYYPSLPPNLLFEKFEEYDIVLIINPDYMRNFISTKFYEIIYTRTPIVYIAKTGMASEFVNDNRLGIAIQGEDIEMQLDLLLNKKNDLNYNYSFDIQQNSFDGITNNVIKLFK